MKLHEVLSHPLFGVVVTITAYVLSLMVQKRLRWLHPLFLTSAVLVAFLLLAGIPYEEYRVGGDIIAFFLGPATVALGVPLYKHARRIRRNLWAVLGGITAGSVAGMASSVWFVWWLGGTREIMLSLIPKSVTSPISMDISAQLGGYPGLTASVTVLSGLLGSMFGPELLRRAGIDREVPLGTAVGTAAHGIGTARVLTENELTGSISGFSMAVAGIAVSVLSVPILLWGHP